MLNIKSFLIFWKEEQERQNKEIKMGSISFKKMRMEWLIRSGDEEEASFIAIMDRRLMKYFLEKLNELNPTSKFIKKFCA